MTEQETIFEKYYSKNEFYDMYTSNEDKAVDVIIPVLNTNPLWKNNLLSFYKEIPISRLLIGDGGCTDDTLDIVKEFPRVEILTLPETSLGYRIRKLIELVDTTYFVYLHSDVYLPENWFKGVYKYRNEYEWFETNAITTVLIQYLSRDKNNFKRSLSGSQFGQAKILKEVAQKIDDDYSYRQEDIIFAELVEEAGGKYARIEDTFHYHQAMNKGAEVPNYANVNISFQRENSKEVEKMIYETQVKGFVKYLKPNKNYIIKSANKALCQLDKLGEFDWSEFSLWVKNTNPIWLKHLNKKCSFANRLIDFMKSLNVKYRE